VPTLLAEATLGITPYEPSTGTHCAFVAKTVEYLALGLPVVCTPLESALRYYRGLEGIKFSGADGASFAARMLEWLALSAEARRAAVEPARRKVEAELNWPAICRRAADFIEGAGSPSHPS
jgi:glycosyltransferase involved in cell wall biosynthesis